MNRSCRTLIASALITLACFGARAGASEQWTAIAVDASREAGDAPGLAKRRLATVDNAIGAALARTSAHGNGNGNGSGDTAAQNERRDAAVAVAAFAVLEYLYPEQREHLDTRLALTFSHIPETQAKAEGAALGRRIGNEVVAATK